MALHENSSFYSDLPLLKSFWEVSNPQNFHSFPNSWYIGITDIINSTKATREGRYKTVNILGASPIIGLLNLENKDDIPYTFGGDGCMVCIPPSMLEKTHEVFGVSKQIGKSEYSLDLRAAIIPFQHIRDAGHDLKVSRCKISDAYNQALFIGDGLGYAEKILKSSDNLKYDITAKNKATKTDFTGLECRWKEVGQKNKKVMTLLVKSNPSFNNMGEVYQNVLKKIENIFGFDSSINPIDPTQLNMNMSLSSLLGELKFRTFGMGWTQRIKYILKMEFQILFGKLLMKLGYRSSVTDWSSYKLDLAVNSDYRKFDDMLRLVISSTEKQIKEMAAYLDKEFNASRLAYGLNINDKAVITCMVFKYHREHIHFVDGSGGGYVLAAKKLKERMSKLDKM